MSDYSDALVYLSDLLDYYKAKDRSFSKKKLALSVGLSPALFSMKLLGQRRMEIDLFRRILEVLPLSKKDRSEVEALFATSRGDGTAVPIAQSLPQYRKTQKPDVYQYSEPQRYFQDYLGYWKTNGKETLKEIAFRHAIHPTSLSRILNGHKEPTLPELRSLMPFFGLNEDEQEHLQGIWLIGSETNAKTRLERYRALLKEAEKRKRGAQSLRAYQFVSNWAYPVIRDLMIAHGQLEDEFWIQKHLRFSVTLKEIREVVRFLLEQNFLRLDGKKILGPGEPVRAEGGVFRLTMMKYHESVLDRAKEGLHKFDRNERHYLCNVLAIGAEDYERAVAIIKEAQEKLGVLGARPRGAKKIIQVVQNIFPMADLEKKRGNNE